MPGTGDPKMIKRKVLGAETHTNMKDEGLLLTEGILRRQHFNYTGN